MSHADFQSRHRCTSRNLTARAAAPWIAWLCMLLNPALGTQEIARAADQARSAARPPSVLAAASLTGVMTATADAYSRRSGIRIRQSFASSAQLSRQLAAGARADILVTADQEWMDQVQAEGLLRPATRRVLAGNRLVVIAPVGAATRLEPASPRSWQAAIGAGRLVTGDPESVPLGRYARAALRQLGVWERLETRVARAENARAALALVARGEAALGIVYATDAKGERRVRVLATLDAALHPPVEYPAALTLYAGDAAAGYLEFLSGAEGQQIFRRHGFTVAAAQRPTGARSASPRPE